MQLQENKAAVTFKGAPFTLIGNLPKIGEKIPEAMLTDSNLNVVSISSLIDKPSIILSVPSLDTDVCSREAHHFNEKMDQFSSKVHLITISMDLPFAQKRWCGAHGIEHMVVLSDYRDAQFGKHYGLLIKELHLLARSILIVDAKGILRNFTLVKEVTEEPNYEQIMQQVKALI